MNNRKSWIAPSVLSILLIAALVWGYNQYKISGQYETALDNYYQRLFYDVKSNVEKIQTSLAKALVAKSKERNVLLFTQIMNDAADAKDKLAQMPMDSSEAASTVKFLTQASDYSYYLIQKHLEGVDITPEQRAALKDIRLNTEQFNSELTALSDSISDNNFMVGMANAGIQGGNSDGLASNTFVTSLVNLDKEVAKSPELIYDGPFADQMLNKKPVGLTGNQVDMNQAQQIALNFVGNNATGNILAFEEGANINDLRIPAYTFQVESNQGRDILTYVSVSKQGGKVLNLNNPRGVTQKNLSVEQGQQRALEFLKSKGFQNMEPNYSLRYDGTVLYNFTYTQDNVTIYPDLVKVKVALDNGEIVGFDAAAYYLNHQDRNLNQVTLTEAQAKEKVKTDFAIDSIRLALIPKGEKEVVCYEFKGKYEGADYIVYINGETGQEEQILQIIKDENGTLTF